MSDIPLNQADWNALSVEVKNRITEILEQNGLLKGSSKIISDCAAPPFDEVMAMRMPVSHNVCMTICSVAEASAHVACSLLPDPVSIAACNAVVTVGGNVCKLTCKPAP